MTTARRWPPVAANITSVSVAASQLAVGFVPVAGRHRRTIKEAT
jgi:hypothetical protein